MHQGSTGRIELSTNTGVPSGTRGVEMASEPTAFNLSGRDTSDQSAKYKSTGSVPLNGPSVVRVAGTVTGWRMDPSETRPNTAHN
ncbi:NAC domain-containing protein 74, partial [Mycobacterium sp. PO1]